MYTNALSHYRGPRCCWLMHSRCCCCCFSSCHCFDVDSQTMLLPLLLLLQVYSFPVYDMIQQGLWRRGIRLSRASWRLIRAAYMLLMCLIAALLPFFGELRRKETCLWSKRCTATAACTCYSQTFSCKERSRRCFVQHVTFGPLSALVHCQQIVCLPAYLELLLLQCCR
jgi:hypothetical protein